jgi:3-hydroxy-9,10-secoandrosta-1,3,5(10)-triene-9,17-dione monooxygenase
MTQVAVNPSTEGTRQVVTGAPSPAAIAEMVQRVHEIGPLLRKNAVVADQQRVMSDESIEALDSIGAMRISAMRRYGGYEGGASMLLEVARTIGYYDPAAAWCTVISNGSVMLANRYSDAVLDEVFADGPVRMASIFASPQGSATPEAGGWRVSGEWPFASNSSHSEWAIGILFIEDGKSETPQIGFALMRRGEYEVKDTWYTIGMRGSGSNTMSTKDLWVPQGRVITFTQLMGDANEKDPDATFARRLTPHLTMSTTIQAASLGAATAALDYVTEKAQTRGITYTRYKRQIDSGAFVQNLGQTSMKIDSALLLLERSACDIDAAAAGNVPMPLADRARNRGGIGHAGHELVDAVNELCWLHGTAAFAENSLLGRMWRDINTGTRHASITAPMGYELHGNGMTETDYISTKL